MRKSIILRQNEVSKVTLFFCLGQLSPKPTLIESINMTNEFIAKLIQISRTTLLQKAN